MSNNPNSTNNDPLAGVGDDVDDLAVAAAEAAAAEDDEAVAAAAVAAVAADAADPPQEPAAAAPVAADPSVDMYTKWNKNAFGAPVAKQSGKFSKEESDLVRKAVEEFCAAKQISTARLCSECDHKAELKGAWMEIAKRIPHRSVQSVYRHGIRRLHPFKRGTWSEAECAMLVELVARVGKKWSTIQGKLNRSADACRDKYREMSDDYIKGRWKEAETEQLKDLIREIVGLGANSNMDMKAVAKLVEEQNIQIPWSTVSKRMGKRSRLSCFKKWQKMTGATGEDEGFDPETLQQELMVHKRKATATEDPAGANTAVHKRVKAEAQQLGTNSSHNRSGLAGTTYSQAPSHQSAHQAAAVAMLAAAEGGTAAAPAAAASGGGENSYDHDVYSSAKMADETVEAVGLPDARSSFV